MTCQVLYNETRKLTSTEKRTHTISLTIDGQQVPEDESLLTDLPFFHDECDIKVITEVIGGLDIVEFYKRVT